MCRGRGAFQVGRLTSPLVGRSCSSCELSGAQRAQQLEHCWQQRYCYKHDVCRCDPVSLYHDDAGGRSRRQPRGATGGRAITDCTAPTGTRTARRQASLSVTGHVQQAQRGRTTSTTAACHALPALPSASGCACPAAPPGQDAAVVAASSSTLCRMETHMKSARGTWKHPL